MTFDSITVAFPHFVRVTTRGGWDATFRVDQIQRVYSKRGGGSVLEVEGKRPILIDVRYRDVLDTLERAALTNGGNHATATR